MKTTEELIEWLRDRTDYLETALYDGEIGDELDIMQYRESYPCLHIKQGYIDLDCPAKLK